MTLHHIMIRHQHGYFNVLCSEPLPRNKLGCHWNVIKCMNGSNIILMCQVRNEALIQLMQLFR